MNENKKYLHLYLGCWGVLDIGEPPHFTEYEDGKWALSCGILEHVLLTDSASFKPMLRPLSDMIDYEYQEWMKLRGWVHENFKGKEGVENGIHCGFGDGFSASYLLKQGFDLFGLIELGFAIDKTK